MANTTNIFFVGPMGAGKSTIGRHVAQELNLDFFDSDQVIESRTGADIAWIYDLEGEEGFRKREKEVIEDLTSKTSIVLATGGGSIITPENRVALASRGIVIYLKSSLASQYDRTRRDAKRPQLHTDNVKETITDLWEEREPLYQEIADYCFDTDHLPVKTIANKIITTLQKESYF